MNLQLDHALALVTASTGGIGKEIATTLAREGVTVIINGRTPASVEAAIADIRASVPSAKLEKLAADNGTAAGAAETVRQFPEVSRRSARNHRPDVHGPASISGTRGRVHDPTRDRAATRTPRYQRTQVTMTSSVNQR